MRAAVATPALIERGRAVTYQELAQQSWRLAQGLRKLGVAPGERVALWLPNVTAWLACLFACARIGAIAVSVNTRFRSHELADIIARAGARVLVCWPAFRGIDFAAILADCDPRAMQRLERIIVYTEGGEPAPQAILGRPVALVVVVLVPDRLLVGHALGVDALADQPGDPIGSQTHPARPMQEAADVEQPDRLVERVVPVVDEEARIGQDRSVEDERRVEPARHRDELGGAGVDHRPPGRRVVVP